MITAKTIEKYRYFTTGTGDIWMLVSVETVKIARVERLADRPDAATADCAEIVVGQPTEFVPVPLPDIPAVEVDFHDEQLSSEYPPDFYIEKPAASKPEPKRAGRNSTTGIKGVSRSGKKFRATATVNGKTKGLGTFTTPELAAAAVADHDRRMADTHRLRRIPAGQSAEPQTRPAGEVLWQCNKCGRDQHAPQRPVACGNCGDTSFSRVANPFGRRDLDNCSESPDE